MSEWKILKEDDIEWLKAMDHDIRKLARELDRPRRIKAEDKPKFPDEWLEANK